MESASIAEITPVIGTSQSSEIFSFRLREMGRSLLHTMASTDGNQAVRRLAIVCLRNGSPQRETIVLLSGLAEDADEELELRKAARTVAAELRKRAGPKG